MQPIRLKPFQFVFGFVSFEQLVQREFIERSNFFLSFYVYFSLVCFWFIWTISSERVQRGVKKFLSFYVYCSVYAKRCRLDLHDQKPFQYCFFFFLLIWAISVWSKSSSKVRQRGFSFKITVYVLSYVHLGRACSALGPSIKDVEIF